MTHPKNQGNDEPDTKNMVKPGSTMDKSKAAGLPQTQPGQQQGQQGQLQPAVGISDQDREREHKRQQEAWDLAARREESNNPETKPQRTYDKDAPGMHPANQPAPDTKFNKATRLDLEDITGNPGHRQVNPDAPAGSINGPGFDRTGRWESINEPGHIDQNRPERSAEGGVQPGPKPTSPRPGTKEDR